MTTLRFDLEWRLTVFTLVLLPALVGLGFWQLERAAEKERLDARFAERAMLPPEPLSALARSDSTELVYRRAEVIGHYHETALILKDNQTRGGRYGVDVITPFFDRSSGQWLLINRGWVPADPARQTLPAVDTPQGELLLVASIYVPPGTPYVLGEENFNGQRWPLRVQDPASAALRQELERRLDGDLYPRELRLAPGQPTGFRRDWPLANSSPERHRGYALQWFTMAAALLLLFLLRSSNLAAVIRDHRHRQAD